MNFKIARIIVLALIIVCAIVMRILPLMFALMLAPLIPLSTIFLLFSSQITKRIWGGDSVLKKALLFLFHTAIIITSIVLTWIWMFAGAVGY